VDFHIPICFPFQNEKNSTFSDLDFFFIIFHYICSLTVPCGSLPIVRCSTSSTATVRRHRPPPPPPLLSSKAASAAVQRLPLL
jgi:hypothetical protein